MSRVICNGNRTEWSPIQSVIIQVINKSGRPCSGSPICLITSMITDRIGRHELLLPINHNFNKICDIILRHEKFLQFDWLRAVVFELNLKYLHVKITNLLRVVV